MEGYVFKPGRPCGFSATFRAMAVMTVLLANGKNGALIEHRLCAFKDNHIFEPVALVQPKPAQFRSSSPQFDSIR